METYKEFSRIESTINEVLFLMDESNDVFSQDGLLVEGKVE